VHTLEMLDTLAEVIAIADGITEFPAQSGA